MTIQDLYPFVPSGKNYDAALSFFEALGFTKEWGNDQLCGLKMDGGQFLLQNIENKEWQHNQMIVLEVDDLVTFWERLSSKNLEENFTGVRIKEPVDYPWGREVHIIDPGGVCWHVREGGG
jgi:hypothetical protein